MWCDDTSAEVRELFLDAQGPVFDAVRAAFVDHYERTDPARALPSDFEYVARARARAALNAACRRYYAKNVHELRAKKRRAYQARKADAHRSSP